MIRSGPGLLSNDLDAYTTPYRVFVNADEEVGAALRRYTAPPGDDRSLDVGSTIEIAHRMARPSSRERFCLPGLRHMAPVEDPGA
ncbi:MAG: hypothetical protein Ct9H300mP16_16690 [Pseudomonadota bacterium]|nr:MAG: hypothetical protein Ct9H300mP16_16690 [Pseudomonadota bacterium]